MMCSLCKKVNSDITTVCGHSFHSKCLGGSYDFEYFNNCPQCHRYIHVLDLYSDVLREAGVTEFEDEEERSILKTVLLNEIMNCMIQRSDAPIEMILDRTANLYRNFFTKNYFIIPFVSSALIHNNKRAIIHYDKLRNRQSVFESEIKEALKSACELGHYELVNLVYNIELVREYKHDPLVFAGGNGDYEIMKRLISSNNPFIIKRRFETALMEACVSKSFKSRDDKMKFLDFIFANIDKAHIKKYKLDKYYLGHALGKVMSENDTELVKYLLQKGAKPSPSLICNIIQSGNMEMMTLCYKHAPEYANFYSPESVLLSACKSGSVDMVKYLIDHGIVIKKDQELLTEVIGKDHLDILEFLLKMGARIKDYKYLKLACEKGNLEMIKMLIDYGVDQIDPDAKKCLLLEQFNFNPILEDERKINELLEYFLKIQVNFDTSAYLADIYMRRKENGVYLRQIMADDKYCGLMSKLIQYGLSVNVKLEESQSLLRLACKKGRYSMAKLLIENGAVIRDEYYLEAIKSGNLDTIKLMLQFCDKNSVDYEGSGPLHYIYKIEWNETAVKVFKYLQKAGVNMKIINKHGQNPIIKNKYMDPEAKDPLLDEFLKHEENVLNFEMSIEKILLFTGQKTAAKKIKEIKEKAEKRNEMKQ